MAAPRFVFVRAVLSIAALGVVLRSAPQDAGAYPIASHVALCQDIIWGLDANEQVLVTPPGDQDACVEPELLAIPTAVRAAILAHPDYFLGGCVGPDAHVVPLLSDVTHAEAFDPLALAKLVVDNATDATERAYAYGWLAHLATDAAVGGFAAWHAEGTLAQWDPGDWSTWGYFARRVLAEDYVAEHWVRPAAPFEAKVASALIRRVFLRWDGAGLKHLLRHALGHPPTPGADPVSVLFEVLTADRPPGVGRIAQLTVATLGAFAATDAYAARFERAARDGHARALGELAAITRNSWLAETRPATWRARVTAAGYQRARDAIRVVREQLAADEAAFVAQNLQFAQDAVADGLWVATTGYVPYFEALPTVLAARLQAIFVAVPAPSWATDFVADLGAAAPQAASALGVSDLAADVRGRYDALAARVEDDAWPWLEPKAIDALLAALDADPFGDAVALFQDLTREALDGYFPVRYDLIDGDFEAAGATRDAPVTASLGCIRGYPFYHNARVLTWSALSAPRNLDGLVSADLPCELRNTRIFRAYDGGDYTTFARNIGPDPEAERPYCFAAGPDYTTRFAGEYVEERDWPFVDRCVAGHDVRERLNAAACAPATAPPGRCPSGAVAVFSDTGSPLACGTASSTTDIWRTSPGTPPQRVWSSVPAPCSGGLPCAPTAPSARALSPDGTALVFVDADASPRQIRVARLDGGADLTYPSVVATFAWDPHWAPDSHAVAFVGDAQGGKLGPIVVLDVAAGTTTELLRGYHPRWAHDSASLFFFAPTPGSGQSGRMVRHTFGPCGTTAPIQTTPVVPREVPMAVARDGRVLYYQTPYSAQTPYVPNQGSLVYGIRSADDASAVTFTLPFSSGEAAWTPDGRRLVMAAVPSTGAAWSHVYLVDVGTGLPAAGTVPAVTDLGRGREPRLSRDGRWLGYVRHDATSSACGASSVSPGPVLGIAVVSLAVEPPSEVLVTGLGPCDPDADCACAGDLPFAWSTTPAAAVLFASFWGGDKPPLVEGAPPDRDIFAFDVPTGLVWEPLTDDPVPFSAPFVYDVLDPVTGQVVTACDPTGRATIEDGVTGVGP